MKYFKGLLQIILGVVCIAISAQITFDIPLSGLDIPITGQTFGVILVAYFCHSFYGALSVFAYLFLGAIGFPIFADGAFGWEKISGGSGGFLIGFLAASLFVFLIKKNFDHKKLSSIVNINLGATLLIIMFGVGRLSFLFGFEKALEYGFYPFWMGAIVKMIAGIATMFIFQKWKAKEKKSIR